MKIKNILTQHSSVTFEGALMKNLGDSYLLKHNEIFRKVRKAALAYGFQFTSSPSLEYTSLPLSQLETLLAEKRIPYQNNVDVLEQIERKVSNQIEWDHVVDGLKKNHIFHESCHAIARTCSRQISGIEKAREEQQFKITLMVLEESFANTCEFLAVCDVHDALHRIFFELNSYICIFEVKTLLKNAITELGFEGFFKFILLSYVHANFLNEKIQDDHFRRVVLLAFGKQLDAAQSKTLRSLGKNAFLLNPRFRYVTTGFYLRMNDIPQSVELALSFDQLEVIENSLLLKELLQNLTNILTTEIDEIG